MNIKPGDYFLHYKGSLYVVDYVAYHSETKEPLIIYHEKLGSGKRWARPLNMWEELVTKGDRVVPRFRRFLDA